MWRIVTLPALALGLLIALAPGQPSAGNRPVITISHGRASPERIEVHAGELVRWRTAGGELLRLTLDAHAAAHEVTVRAGEVRVVFREPGEHWYSAGLALNGRGQFRGLVVVRRAEKPPRFPPVCGPDTRDVICIER